jgi:hypothetical protein
VGGNCTPINYSGKELLACFPTIFPTEMKQIKVTTKNGGENRKQLAAQQPDDVVNEKKKEASRNLRMPTSAAVQLFGTWPTNK